MVWGTYLEMNMNNFNFTVSESIQPFRDDIKLCHWVPKGSIFLKIDQNQLSFLFGFYLKKERKKIERKKVRARPLCHPRQPTHEPFRFIGHINASVP